MTENRSNYFKNYFMFQLGRLKICTVFSIIFAFLGFPLILLATEDVIGDLELPLLLLGIFCILGTCAMSYITPIIAFRHLYTKTNADNILSLPVTTDQRYLADVMATFISYAVPYFLSTLLNLFLSLFYSSRDILTIYPLKGALMLVMFGALNIAVMTLCGRVAEAILYPIAINIVFPLTIGLGAYFAFTNAVGMPEAVEDVLRSPAMLMFPFGNFIGILYFEKGNNVIWGIIGAVIFLILSFIGYKKRRAENIGKPFVFRYSYALTSSLVAIALIFLYQFIINGMLGISFKANNIAVIIVLAIIIFIAMLLMEIINYKKIHSVPKFLLRYAVTTAIGFGACFVLAMSHGLGLEGYIPEAKDVEYVKFYGNYRDTNWNRIGSGEIYVYTPETIELITAEHKNTLEKALEKTREKDDDYNHSYSTIEFSYTLKNGRTVCRRYGISENLTSTPEIWDTLYASEDCRTNSVFNTRFEMADEDYVESYTIRIQNPYSDKIYDEINVGDGMAFLEAVEKDLKNDTLFNNHNELAEFEVNFGYMQQDRNDMRYDYYDPEADHFRYRSSFIIYSNYTNTINYLDSISAILPSAEVTAEDITADCEIFTLTRQYQSGMSQASEEYSSQPAMIFITAEEYKELVSHQTNLSVPDEKGCVYTVRKGIYSDVYHRNENYGSFEKNILDALDEIGIDYNDPVDESILSYNIQSGEGHATINSSVSDYCEQLFSSGRSIFHGY